MSKGYLYAVISAVTFGCMAFMTKVLYSFGVSSLSAIFYRFFASAIVFYFLAKRDNPDGIPISARDIKKMIYLTLGFVSTPMLLYASYFYIDSGTATVLHFTYPVLIILFQARILKRKIELFDYLCAGLAILGVVLLLDLKNAQSLQGIILSLLSGVTYTGYSLYLEESGLMEMGHSKMMFYLISMSAFTAFATAVIKQDFFLSLNPIFLLYTVFFSLSLTVFGVLFYQKGVYLVGARKTAILSTLEPTVSVIVGVLFLNELMTFKSTMAILLIIVSGLLVMMKGKKSEE